MHIIKGYSFILPGLDLHPVTSSCQSHFVPECLESPRGRAGGRTEVFSEKKGLCSFNMTGSLNPGTLLTHSLACLRAVFQRGPGLDQALVSSGAPSKHCALCRRVAEGEMNSKL